MGIMHVSTNFQMVPICIPFRRGSPAIARIVWRTPSDLDLASFMLGSRLNFLSMNSPRYLYLSVDFIVIGPSVRFVSIFVPINRYLLFSSPNYMWYLLAV